MTNAGLLFCDQGYLKQSKVVCTRWKGTEKGSVEGDALDDEEFTGVSLITLLANAEAFIRTNSKNPWSIRGMRLSIGIIRVLEQKYMWICTMTGWRYPLLEE